MKTLENQLTEKALLDLAGKTIYGRGLDYFEGGLVSDLRMINQKLRATISGSDDYGVMLWADAHGLDYKNNGVYDGGAELVRTVRALMQGSNQ